MSVQPQARESTDRLRMVHLAAQAARKGLLGHEVVDGIGKHGSVNMSLGNHMKTINFRKTFHLRRCTAEMYGSQA